MADTEKEPFYETPESLEKVKLLEAEVAEKAAKIQTDNKESTFRQLLHELVAFADVHQNKISEIIDPFIKWESVATSGIFGFTVFATWFLVRFGFSVAWLIPLVSLVSSIYKSTVQRVQRKARNEAKKEFAIMEMDRDKESVEWFNSFLSRFWRNYEPGLSQGIKDTIDLTLDYYKPSGIDELRLTIFTLGSEGPRIDSIKTFANTDQETLLMDMDLSFIPVEANSMSKNEILLKDVRNVEIELLAKVGPIPFQISVREFSLAGTMRVQLKFMGEYPHIKVVDIGFVNKPEIDFILQPLGTMDINKIGGLGDFIKETVQSQIAAIMVNPIKMSFPIGEWMGADFGAIELPVGILRVSIYEASGLRNVDVTGISDPLAIIKIGGSEVVRTRIIENNCDPKWNEVHHVVIFKSTLTQIQNKSDDFKLSVMHSNPLSDRDLGSTVSLPLHRWLKLIGLSEPPNETKPKEESEGLSELSKEEKEQLLHEWGSPLDNFGGIWKKLALQNKPAGSIRLNLTYFPVKEILPPGVTKKFTRKDLAGIVTIIVHQAKELGVGAQGQVDVLAYAESQQIFATPVRKRTGTPNWEFKKVFFCEDIFKSDYKFVVRNRGDPIGHCSFNVHKALNTNEDWYQLFGHGSGKIRISCKFVPIDTKMSQYPISKEIRLDPIGLLRINVLSGIKLANVELIGKSDPYCKVYLHGRAVGVTSVQKGSLNPNWNEIFFTTVFSMKESLSLEVCDSNDLSKDRALGKINLQLGALFAHLKKSKTIQELNQLGAFELDGLQIDVISDKTLKIIAPLYLNQEEAEQEEEPTENLGELDKTKTRSQSFFKKGLSSLSNDLMQKKVLQKGHILFELEMFGVLQDLVIEPADMEELLDLKDQENESLNQQENTEKPIAQINSEEKISQTVIDTIGKLRTGILRMKVESGDFKSNCRPYVIVLINEESVFSTIAPSEPKQRTHWYSAKDHFVLDLAAAKIMLLVKDQLKEEGPHPKDPYLGFWTGDFVGKLLGKGNHWISFRQYSENSAEFESLPETCSINVSFGFAPVKLDSNLTEAENIGVLHLDILSAKNLLAADANGKSDPFCIIKLNGVEREKTKVQKKTLNPVWEETFDLQIYSRIRTSLLIELFDHDAVGSNDPLGQVSLNLVSFKVDEVTTLELPVQNGEGTIKIRYLFEPKELDRKLANFNYNNRRLTTEASGFGKFSRGITGQVSGLKSQVTGSFEKLIGKKKESDSNISISVEPPTAEKKNIGKERKSTTESLNNEVLNGAADGSSNIPSKSMVDEPRISMKSNFSLSSLNESRLSVTSLGVQEIEIKILSAENLTPADKGGTSDPYVKVYFKDDGKGSFFKTNICKKTLNPVWTENTFSVSTSSAPLIFKIFDRNLMNADIPLGHVTLDVCAMVQNEGSFSASLPIIEGSGNILISGNLIESVKKSKKKRS